MSTGNANVKRKRQTQTSNASATVSNASASVNCKYQLQLQTYSATVKCNCQTQTYSANVLAGMARHKTGPRLCDSSMDASATDMSELLRQSGVPQEYWWDDFQDYYTKVRDASGAKQLYSRLFKSVRQWLYEGAHSPRQAASPNPNADLSASPWQGLSSDDVSSESSSPRNKQIRLNSGWWGLEPHPKKKLSKSSLFGQFKKMTKQLTVEMEDIDLTKPGIYYLENLHYPQFRYVGQTTVSLVDRLYQHIAMAFSETGRSTEPLSLPLLCTIAARWKIEVLTIEKGTEGKRQFEERLNALETKFIGQKCSWWPNGLNLQMPLTLNSLEAFPVLKQAFVKIFSDEVLYELLK